MPTCEPSLTPYVDSGLYTVTPTRGWLDHYNLLGSNVEAPLLWRTGAHDGPCALEWVRLARAVASGRSAVIKRFYVSTVSLEPLGWRCRSARSRPSRWSSHPSSASRRCLFTATLREEPRLAAPSHAALVRSPQPQGRLGRPCVEPRRTLVPGGRRTARALQTVQLARGLLRVAPAWLRHMFSSPRLQARQVRSEPTMQPTPTWSPVWNLVTSEPTATTTPATSCPGTTGQCCGMPRSLVAPTCRWGIGGKGGSGGAERCSELWGHRQDKTVSWLRWCHGHGIHAPQT